MTSRILVFLGLSPRVGPVLIGGDAPPFRIATAVRQLLGGRTAEASLILVGRVLGAVLQVVSLRVSTQLLSPAQFGAMSQLASVTFIFLAMLITPVSQYVSRGFLEWRDAGTLLRNLRHYIRYIAIVALMATLVAGALQWQLRLVSGFTVPWVMALVALYVMSNPLSALGTTGFNLQQQRGKFVFFSILSALLSLVFAVGLFMLHRSPEWWSLGQFLGLSVACVSLVILVRSVATHANRPGWTPEHSTNLLFSTRPVFAFAWPVIITAALWWIQSHSYKFVLDRVHGTASVGLFGIGYALAATPLSLYESTYGQFYEPIFYSELKNQDSHGQARAWNNYASAYLPGIISVGVFLASSGAFLAQALVAESFREAAVKVVMWAALIESLRVVGGLFYQVGIAKIDMRLAILPVMIGAILAPTGVWFFGRRMDPIIGTAVGLLIAGVAAQSAGIVMSRRWLPIKWPFRRMALGAALSLPLVFWFRAADWLLPGRNLVVAILILGAGGLYLLAVQAFLFNMWRSG